MKKFSKLLSILLCLSLVLSFLPTIASAAETTPLATFTFGSQSTGGSWVDGSDMGTSKSYTAGNYTLAFTNCSKVYTGGNDFAGTPFIKFGTSSVVGTVTFTVPNDVTSVVLHVAGYKAKTSKYTINGGSEVTISVQTAYSEGESTAYEEVTIDTSSTKTVTISTVSGSTRMVL